MRHRKLTAIATLIAAGFSAWAGTPRNPQQQTTQLLEAARVMIPSATDGRVEELSFDVPIAEALVSFDDGEGGTRAALTCYWRSGKWGCEDPPFRLLRIDSECPVALIRLDPAVSVRTAESMLARFKSEWGGSFLTITKIERSDLEGRDLVVYYTLRNGTGLVHIDSTKSLVGQP